MATKDEKRHLNAVAALGCIVCYSQGHEDTPAEIHHIRDGQGISQRAHYTETIPLCPIHHRLGDGTAKTGYQWGYHMNPTEFEARYGTERDLLGQILNMLDCAK
jgi:hypothetical protein